MMAKLWLKTRFLRQGLVRCSLTTDKGTSRHLANDHSERVANCVDVPFQQNKPAEYCERLVLDVENNKTSGPYIE
jgi:hypothetical protein